MSRGRRVSGYRPGFRPDIEGLRAVAVLGVVGFHAAVPRMSGGYVGVDVFFVISGFLITGLILADLDENGRLRLRDFYARRARRILPAAAVVLAATGVACALWMAPLRRQDTAVDMIAAALNVSNWRFVALQTDYLAAARAESPLLHFWSLAVEEQFYLVWAPLALGLALLARRFRRSPFPVLAVAVSAICVVSFVLCLHWTATNVPLAYLGSPSRAWQFGIGALGALASPLAARLLRRGAGRVLAVILGCAGAAALAWSVATYTAIMAFPGAAALVPTLATAAIIVAGCGNPSRGVAWALGTRPVRFVGRLSYSWYLWHWPVLVLCEARFGLQPWPVKVGLMLGSAVPAWLTMRLVERPIRLSPRLASMPWRSLTAGLVAILLPVAAGLFLHASAASELAANRAFAAAAGRAAPPPQKSTAPVENDDGHLYLAPLPTIPPGPPRPAPEDARSDQAPVGACRISNGSLTNGACLFGNVDSPDRVVLLGDSHATQWYPGLAEVAKPRGWAIEVLAKAGCALHTFVIEDRPKGFYGECAAWRDKVIDRVLREPKPKFIFVATMMERQYAGGGYIDSWDEVLNRLRAFGSPIVYLRDSPYPGKDVPDCVSGMRPGSDECDFPRADTLFPDAMADLIRAGGRPGVYLLDFTDALCPLRTCRVVIDGIIVYHDRSHLTATAAQALSGRMAKQLIGYRLIGPA